MRCAAGASRAVNNTVVIPQSVLLNHTARYAVCYASLNGTSEDYTWRDSFIRVAISEAARGGGLRYIKIHSARAVSMRPVQRQVLVNSSAWLFRRPPEPKVCLH